MKIIKAKQEAELAHAKAMIEMEVAKKRQLAEIEANRFKHMIEAIGQETITNIARAGPEMQAKLLSGLGIKSRWKIDYQTAQNDFAARSFKPNFGTANCPANDFAAN